MTHNRFGYLLAALVLIPLAGSFSSVAYADTLAAMENDEGQVTVSVTPLDVSETASAWRFEVRLNTHAVPIAQDMMSVAVLGDGTGYEEKPLAWQGDPPGGHHRKGELSFKPISPRPSSVTLRIREVGGVPERAFTWDLTAP